MPRYVYALVRCVPDPRTGEFVNVAAIAGNASSGDWSLRQVSNESRVRRLAGTEALGAVHSFLARTGQQIDAQVSLLDRGADASLDEKWLYALRADLRNVVQLSEPTPIVANDAEGALDIIFSRLIIDPVTQPRVAGITKHRVLKDLRDAYRSAQIADGLVQSHVEVFVGDRLHTPVDFAIGNGTAVQLSQAWSFQRAGTDEISLEVKAWGYALTKLRDGETTRVVGADERVSHVSADVDLEVVFAEPKTHDQRQVFEEASQVFLELGARMQTLEAVGQVGNRARTLLSAHA